jgi:hypothetical protein
MTHYCVREDHRARRLHRAGSHASVERQSIARGASSWLTRPQGRRVICEAGTLWLTHDGEDEDVILEAGECHHCSRSSKLLIHALAGGTFRVA